MQELAGRPEGKPEEIECRARGPVELTWQSHFAGWGEHEPIEGSGDDEPDELLGRRARIGDGKPGCGKPHGETVGGLRRAEPVPLIGEVGEPVRFDVCAAAAMSSTLVPRKSPSRKTPSEARMIVSRLALPRTWVAMD